MLFKNPSLLYGLFFLVIPIIIHLFQLRRFQQVAFTNVAFLKPLITETRKSNRLKKWLTLLARMLAIACLVMAFAQPYATGNSQKQEAKQTAIYIDNSYSMQAAGSAGPLYTSAVNQLLEKLPAEKVFTLFTNDKVFLNTTKQQIANDLLQSGWSNRALSYEQVQLKAVSLLDSKATNKELLILSDFQKRKEQRFPDTLAGLKRELVQLLPEKMNNISLDTAYIASRNGSVLKIALSLSANYEVTQPVTISLKNKATLVAKTSADLNTKQTTVYFEINAQEPLTGTLSIDDNGLQFDNELFIATGSESTINVLTVSDGSDQFLRNLYTEPDFKLTAVQTKDLNFNLIKEQNLIVLNEVATISPALAKELNEFMTKGGYIVVIPNENATGYEAINHVEKAPPVTMVEKKVTTINTKHPLLQDVFSGDVTNFQYPSVTKTVWNTTGYSPIMNYQDGLSFLYKNKNAYVFTAPLNVANSNFQNSPLIVPVFYKMGTNSLPIAQLYYTLDTDNTIAIPTVIENDEILNLKLDETVVIPQQRGFNSYVLLQTDDNIDDAGNYAVLKNKELVNTLSFNSSRKENVQNYFSTEELGNNVSESIDDLVYKLTQEDTSISYWKYFVLAALFFLICELLILKFVP